MTTVRRLHSFVSVAGRGRHSVVLAVMLALPVAADGGEPTVDFTRDVRPLLVRHCDRCHGTKNQEAGLQLNLRSSAFGHADSGEPIIVPGDSKKSLLIRRLTDSDEGDVMPFDGEPLSQQEIRLLRSWIDDGAEWPDEYAEARHWAWEPIERPPSPDPDSSEAVIDQFVRRQLERHSLAPTHSLDRARLIRRASLALIGLPPAPNEVDAFVSDSSPNAFEMVVDRLLASPRYGERWAVPWMDLARYADSNGFQADQLRDNWAWRDWVIRAFNADMPFDEFVIDQLAGDLRPNATIDQKTATGFHRMTTCNVEAGVHPEANRINQIVDRVNTTATVFLGVTLECAQCHDHKYDPFTQEDYYRFFAYFNNTPLEVKKTGDVTFDFYGPEMDLPLDADTAERKKLLEDELAELVRQHREIAESTGAEFESWQAKLRSHKMSDSWQVVTPESFESTGNDKSEIQADGSVLLSGPVTTEVEHTFVLPLPHEPVTAIRLETLTHKSIPGKGPGRIDLSRPDFSLREVRCELVRDGKCLPLDLVSAQADFSTPTDHVASAIDGRIDTGWSIAPQFGKPHQARFVLSKPVHSIGPDDRLKVTLVQGGQHIGRPRISFTTEDPWLVDASDELIAAVRHELPSEEHIGLLRTNFMARHPQAVACDAKIANVQKSLKATEPSTTLVMVEMTEPRATHILTRGDYEQPAGRVTAGTPKALPEVSSRHRTSDRMELARWLTSPSNPLLARVTVNRWWQDLFGTGLVTTPEDFGTQSEPPSHPELFDWLTAEFMSSGWSMKHIHKRIVMSETWQQSAQCDSQVRIQDPQNRLLARGPRFRLPAETIRDNALAISGLLSTKMYGAPVMPYQPNGIWRSVGRNQPKWLAAKDEDRFRRGVYVICKRAALYPSFVTFDAPDRANCTVKRGRSNTPLQALTLLNDRAYAEMGMAFADRILAESEDESDAGRIRCAMHLAVARQPADTEVTVLQKLLDEERRRIANDAGLVESRMKMTPPGRTPTPTASTKLAAWFAVANAILNLAETMTH